MADNVQKESSDTNRGLWRFGLALTTAAALGSGLFTLMCAPVKSSLSSPIITAKNSEEFEGLLKSGRVSPGLLESYLYGKTVDELQKGITKPEDVRELLQEVRDQLQHAKRMIGILDAQGTVSDLMVLTGLPSAQERSNKINSEQRYIAEQIIDEERFDEVVLALINGESPNPESLGLVLHAYQDGRFALMLEKAKITPGARIILRDAAGKELPALTPEAFEDQIDQMQKESAGKMRTTNFKSATVGVRFPSGEEVESTINASMSPWGQRYLNGVNDVLERGKQLRQGDGRPSR